MKNSTKLKAGLLLTSLACAAGATAALVLLQKKREEEVYHEAELKAMDELEEMMRSESDCASCACAEECPAPETYAAAKNDAAHAALAAQLKDHSLARTYVCLVCGRIRDDAGTIDAPIGRHPTDRKKMAVTQKNSRSAVTHWRVLERFAAYTLVECRLETGRTHQIRVHMAYRGHPILGDMVYGHKKPELGQSSQCLHAKELRFVHPRTGEPVTVSCGLPDYFTALLEKLRAGA
mgnify:CR=1 FL=1